MWGEDNGSTLTRESALYGPLRHLPLLRPGVQLGRGREIQEKGLWQDQLTWCPQGLEPKSVTWVLRAVVGPGTSEHPHSPPESPPTSAPWGQDGHRERACPLTVADPMA